MSVQPTVPRPSGGCAFNALTLPCYASTGQPMHWPTASRRSPATRAAQASLHPADANKTYCAPQPARLTSAISERSDSIILNPGSSPPGKRPRSRRPFLVPSEFPNVRGLVAEGFHDPSGGLPVPLDGIRPEILRQLSAGKKCPRCNVRVMRGHHHLQRLPRCDASFANGIYSGHNNGDRELAKITIASRGYRRRR